MIIHPADECAGFNGMAYPDLLAVTNHAPSEIIADHDNNGQPFADGILKLHEIKTDRAVPGQEQDSFFRIPQFSGIGIGQTHGKGTENSVIKVVKEKLKSLSAGRMGYSTRRVGDLVCKFL